MSGKGKNGNGSERTGSTPTADDAPMVLPSTMKSRAESLTAPQGPGRPKVRGSEAGLLYVIAAPPGPEGHRESREVESLLAKHPSRGGEVPGVLWGFVPPSGAAGTGNRVTIAARGT